MTGAIFAYFRVLTPGRSMFHPSLTLQAFIKAVPLCFPKADLQEVVELFHRSQGDLIVVVTPENVPLGAISRSQLVIYLASQKSILLSILQEPLISTPPSPSPKPLLDSSLSWLSQIDFELSTLVQPVSSLPVSLSLREFSEQCSRDQLNSNSLNPWVLTNPQQQILGLLDTGLLLKAIITGDSPSDMTRRIAVNSPLQVSPPQVEGEIWLQLIEQLPFPLLLQDRVGETIRYNSSWHHQILDWVELPEHQHSAPQLLTSLSHFNFRGDHSPSRLEELGITCWCNLPQEESLNKLSDQILPFMTEDGSEVEEIPEKTWQFFKLRLDLNLGHRHQSPVDLIWATEVTNQQRLYQELAAKNADLVQLNRLKDEFLACISHELKTPLTSVVGLSSLLKEKSLGELNQRQTRYANLIYQSGRQLMTLVNDILDLTRLETGQLQLTLEPVQIKEVCHRAYHNAFPRHKEHPPLEFQLDIAPGLETLVADELRLRQMLTHLLSNAFKFTPDGGQVGLHVSSWEGWIDFTVWDTGIGIPDAAQHLIFQKFQQLENPFTRQFEGTGLGLVLTQRLARAHGGDVSFISKVGEGSQFTLLLPPTPPYGQKKNQKTAGIGHPQLILIVEAVPHYIENLTLQLRELGYRVVIARSGTEAVEKARQLQPQVIFLNPILPLLSGWDVLTLLKGDKRTHHIPVIVTATSRSKQQAGNYGANGCLSLPIEKEPLQQSLTHLQNKRHQPPQVLTILHLNSSGSVRFEDENQDNRPLFNSNDHHLNYRILEAYDLEQGELLAQFWKPDVMLLGGLDSNRAEAYLRSLGELEHLSKLPLITLDAETTAIANQISHLSIFPCLFPLNQENESAFIQVIQLAAGIKGPLDILVVGDWELSEPASETNVSPQFPLLLSSPASNIQGSRGWEWLHALIQYLQTAGLKASLAASWVEVYRQIHYHSVDVLLLYVEDLKQPSPFQSGLEQLLTLPLKPPIIVVDRRLAPIPGEMAIKTSLESLLERGATQILDGHSLSMADLLTVIHSIVNH